MHLLKISAKLILIALLLFIFTAISQAFFIFAATIKDNTVSPADLITILPGEENRIKTGHSLVKRGLSQNLLILNQSPEDYKKIEEKYGVLDNIRFYVGKSRSTFEDIYTIQKTSESNMFNSVILVTSPYHIPRSYFLLECLNLATHNKIRVNYFSVNLETTSSFPELLQLYLTEILKLWGSCIELVIYLATDELLLDNPDIYLNIVHFKWKFLYRILPPHTGGL